MKNQLNLILFALLFLSACEYVPATTQAIEKSTQIPTFTPSPFTWSNIPTSLIGITPNHQPYHTPTPTDTATPTSTPDYAALGIPSPTSTPTFEYDRLSYFYLTPFTPMPTFTGLPPQIPTASVQDILANVLVRKATPELPPLKIAKDENGNSISFYQNESEWILGYAQTATDLMNYTDANRELYLQYVENWQPMAFKYSPVDWFIEKDFDNDGQVEWLVSIPFRFEDDGINRCGFEFSHFGYCPRNFYIFEKIDGSYYPKQAWGLRLTSLNFNESRIALVDDLNNDGTQEMIFRADPCGAAVCSTYMFIGRWNGQIWEWVSYIVNDHAKVTFADLDGNGTVEITVAYPTYAASRYNSPYSRRNVVDVYGWKNNRYELVDQIYPPTSSVFETIFDIASALEYQNAELAFRRITPVIETFDQSCDRMKTYIGIQAMLAYGIQGNVNGMKSILAKLEKYCDFPRNAYLPAAKILWLSYEKSHDAIDACEAMERFLWKEYIWENDRFQETLFIDSRPTNRPSCPRE